MSTDTLTSSGATAGTELTSQVGIDPVVDARQVFRTFEAETAPVRALRGADLSVERGEFVAVMGPSGCGKSTSSLSRTEELFGQYGTADRPFPLPPGEG